jgi:hypothetical protein
MGILGVMERVMAWTLSRTILISITSEEGDPRLRSGYTLHSTQRTHETSLLGRDSRLWRVCAVPAGIHAGRSSRPLC